MNRSVSKQAWTEARVEHLAKEKELTRRRDALSSERRELPWLEIAEDYAFDTSTGRQTLLHLFGDKTQLLMYHFMLGPDWVEGCPSCSFWADNFNGTEVHLAARDTAFVAVSRAPLVDIETYRSRMGWGFPWVSSAGSRFNFDMGVSFEGDSGEPNYNFGTQHMGGDEGPGFSAFVREADRVYLTYQTFSRGLDMTNGAYHMLDLTAKGRDEQDLEWSMAWLHRHDAYPKAP